jgi:hypothetical protein
MVSRNGLSDTNISQSTECRDKFDKTLTDSIYISSFYVSSIYPFIELKILVLRSLSNKGYYGVS